MTREEFTEKSAHILEILDDTGAVSTALDELRTGFFEEVEKRETSDTTAEELKQKNEGLLKANMDLFLKVGKEGTGETAPEEADKPTEPEISYDSLFNENGELK